MYKLEYLPAALRDMTEAVQYISRALHNPQAAQDLAQKFVQAGESLSRFPYANPVYFPPQPLGWEYRKVLVSHYLMFYRVDEKERLVTVARVIYAKRDYHALLPQ